MRATGRIGGFALACLLTGCGDDGASGESGTTAVIDGDGSGTATAGEAMNVAPTVEAQADVAAACAVTGATRVELHATRVGCVNPSPCTLPEIPRVTVGDGVDCPAADSPQVLRVELTQTGRYHVEVVSLDGDQELSAVCVGASGEVEVLIDDAELTGNPTIAVEVLDGSACS